jgi:DNA-binding PadR family transcriptional regulator
MSRTSTDDLDATSFALLGLLALQPWTTYELAKQMQRSVRWFWPRAERKIYDEPKRLVALGLATSSSVMTGRRASTVYEITPAGRQALREWIATPAFEPAHLEMEAMVKLFFGDGGSRADMLATLRAVHDQSTEALVELCDIAVDFADERDQFPDRRATNAFTMELYVRLHETIRAWATWAEAEVASWPEVRRGRRPIAAGPHERGRALFAAIAARRPTTPVPTAGGDRRSE